MGTLASGSIDLKSLKVAGEGANKYITTVDGGGIKIHPYNSTTGTADQNNYTQIDGEGMEVYNDSISVAKFGENVRIGGVDNTKIIMNGNGINAQKEDDTSYFKIGLSETIEELIDFRKSFLREDGFSAANYFYLKTDETYAKAYAATPIGNTVYVHAYVSLQYGSNYPYDQNHAYHNTSYSFTKGTSETYNDSFFELEYNASSSNPYIKITLNGETLHSYSHYKVLTLNGSFYVIAETPAAVYSFGANTSNTKPLSFSVGNGTCASHSGFACGKYNIVDSNDEYAFIVGNGDTSLRTHSNAFTVDWNGNVNIAVNTTAISGDDFDLYTAISNLEWTTNVIV